jgi:ring-1,2-phenylacetyl-CoA epoxidase subunit PaaC
MTFFAYLLSLADDALLAAQRLSEWCSRAPEMEEDIALANIALDQLGVARQLLTYAGEVEGLGRDEDALAYRRDDRDFRNVQLVELDNGDFAVTMAKLLFLSAYQLPLYDALSEASDERLAGIAAKARKESAYHLDHSSLWTVRLGDGTDESHLRMQAALDRVWPYTHELFEPVEGALVEPASLRAPWLSTVDTVLAGATLTRPADGWRPTGGRRGVHTEALSLLLAEMQVLHRGPPGGPMVTAVLDLVGEVPDPELRVVSIAELGILRDVSVDAGRVVVTITPTYSGCPAMDAIRADIEAALHRAGHGEVDVRTVLSPAWTTDWITEDGRASWPRPA